MRGTTARGQDVCGNMPDQVSDLSPIKLFKLKRRNSSYMRGTTAIGVDVCGNMPDQVSDLSPIKLFKFKRRNTF